LTRLIIRKLPKEYDVAVKTVRDLHRFWAYGKEGDISKITNLEDNTRRNYETEWLPRYLELRTELIREYNLLKRRRDEETLLSNKSPGHPTLPLQGFDQPGPKALTCYGCGQPGHRRGDQKCAAGPKDVWAGAPDSFKELVKKRGNDFPKKKFNGEKGICFNWSRGNGYCKYGDACRFKLEGPKGDSGGGKRKAALIVPKPAPKKKDKGKKKQKGVKSIASMVVKDMKKAMLKEDDASSSGEAEEYTEDSLFKLIRNESVKDRKKRRVNFIVTLAGEEKSYVPRRWSAMMVTDNGEGDKFVPQRPGGSGETKASTGEKRERSVSSEGSRVDKGESSPAEEAIAITVAEETKPRQRRKKTKKFKLKAEKSEVRTFREEKASSSSDWGRSNPPIPDWGKSTSSTCDSAMDTPVHLPVASAPTTERSTYMGNYERLS
jgi:hypothetical protein